MFPAQSVQVTCPQCKQPFTASLHSIIDVGANPTLKEELLRGRLNVALCPNCGASGALGAPILYHDPEKELAFVLVPHEMNLPLDEQEKIIGQLTNALMSSLPPERRKGYLLQPRTFLTFESWIRAILEADGITEEMLEEQEKRLQLIQEMRSRMEQEEELEAFVEEHRDEIDYELLLILRAVAETTRAEGSAEEASVLEQLHQRLVEWLGEAVGPAPGAQVIQSYEELVQVLREASDKESLLTIVAANRPVFDYIFFQHLAGQIEAAEEAGEAEEAAALRQLREDVLEATETIDRETQQVLEGAVQRLQQIVNAENPEAEAEKHLEEIDEAFLIVLSANIARAEEEGQQEMADRLRRLHQHIIGRLEERMPPQVRVVNRLLMADTVEERAQILAEAGDLINQEMVAVLESMLQDAKSQRQSPLAEELEQILEQIRGHLARSA